MIKLKENSEYFFCKNGLLYRNEELIKPLKDKDGYLYYNIYINGKRVQRYAAKLVARCLIPNRFNFKFIEFIDGNKLNCHPSNIKWISNKQDAEKRKSYDNWHGKKKTSTREEAIEKCTCPILKEYYLTLDIEVINRYFCEIFKQVRKSIKQMIGIAYLYVVDKIKRFTLLGNIKGYIYAMEKFIKCDTKINKTMYSL
jgi:hypothetical protein